MKRIIFYFLILVFAVWLGVVMYNHPGYVLLSYNNWSIESSLWLALLAILIVFVVFYFLLRCSGIISGWCYWAKLWLQNWWQRKARSRTIQGFYELAEGNWRSAEKQLIRGAKYGDMPAINYLAAAFMAQRQFAFARRDEYLRRAGAVVKDQPVAVGLTQARLQIGNQQWEEALATLQQLHLLRPKNAFILQLLQQACLQVKDWQTLKNILPALQKRHACTAAEYTELERKVFVELLIAARANNSVEILWRQLSRHLQKDAKLLAIYIEDLLAHQANEAAEIVLKLILRKDLAPELLTLYAKIVSPKPLRHLARAEEWLKAHPHDANLLLCLGRICKQQMLWGKARVYLEKSAKLLPTPQVYYELGQILMKENDVKGAAEFYSKGLLLH